MKTIKYIVIGMLIFGAFIGQSALADNAHHQKSLKIGGYTLISVVKAGKVGYDFTYKATITNNGKTAFTGVVATLSAHQHKSKFKVLDGNLSFGDVGSGKSVISTDTFALRTKTNKPYTSNKLTEDLEWKIATGVALNKPPAANAGAYPPVTLNSTVKLNGAGSNDPDGDLLSYSWSLTNVPAGSVATLSDPAIVNPSFVADKSGTYTVTLVVNDGKVNSQPSNATITVINTPPIANAGANQTVALNSTVTLDGSVSSDPDGNAITYHWNLTAPPGSNASLSDINASKPTFTVDVVGTYVAQLIVNDGLVDSAPSLTQVIVEAVESKVEISTSPNDLQILVGQTKNIATSLTFNTATPGIADTITVSQTVMPSGGLSLSPPVDGNTFTPSADFGTVLNQEITAFAVGVYEITTTATISQTGQSSTTKVKFTVTTGQQSSFILGEPGSDPGALPLNKATPVLFTVQVQGDDLKKINTVNLTNTTTGSSLSVNDEGLGGDLAANDGTYSGTTIVDTTDMIAQQCQSFQATATTTDSPVTSPIYKLCITSFPIGTQPSDLTNLVTDPITGQSAIADEVLVGFVTGTLEDKIISIVASVNAAVVGTVPGLGVYQVRLNPPVNSPAELTAIINTLTGNPEVRFAEAAVLVSVDTVVPSDAKFAQQEGLKKIRADEAWYIARGAVTIAIVDTGVDLNHEDLKNKLLGGFDFVGSDNVPMDEYGHGTLVAGIAAAETNQGTTGIAGISWGSKIVPVRVNDGKENSGNNTPENLASGIKWAGDKGARIINVSLASFGGKKTICDAVAYATSKRSLVIAAAGNYASSTEVYPAACPGVIAVGNTKLDDTRMPNPDGSNYGPWVDLAAPGQNVVSTVPMGPTTLTCPFCMPDGYKKLENGGTSLAAPMVSGAAAVLLSRESLTNAQVEERLKRTAKKLDATLQLGAGRIDLFEAVFNGSFEEENMALWQIQGTVASLTTLGTQETKPQDRYRLGYASTGPDGAQVSGSLTQNFQVQAGVTSIPITFKYAFLSEEFPEFVGSTFNDSLTIKLTDPNGTETTLATESINSSAYTMIGGLDFPGGDSTVGWTGWKPVSVNIPITAGPGTYSLFLTDAGDSIYDSVVLIDCIQFRIKEDIICTPAP